MRSESKIFHRWSADVRVYRLKLSKKSFMLTTPSQTLFQGRFCLGITITWICTQVLINLNFKEFQPGLTSRHGHWTFDGHFKIESRISALLMRKHNMNIKLTGDINSRRQLTGGWSTRCCAERCTCWKYNNVSDTTVLSFNKHVRQPVRDESNRDLLSGQDSKYTVAGESPTWSPPHVVSVTGLERMITTPPHSYTPPPRRLDTLQGPDIQTVTIYWISLLEIIKIQHKTNR